MIVSVLLVTILGGFAETDKTSSDMLGSVSISVYDNNRTPIEGTNVWLYGCKGEDPILLISGKTNEFGKFTINNMKLDQVSLDSRGEYYDFVVHAAHPNYSGVKIKNWSEAKNELLLTKGAKNIDFVIDTSKIKVGSKASTRSMNYRTVRLDRFDKDAATTMITMYHDKNNMSEFPVKATFESGVVNTVTTAVHFTIPMASQWTAGGFVSRSTGSGLGQHWYNTAIGTKHDGIECQTLFRYVHEVWEYQRQDDDIYDLWHTEEQWVEVKVKEHRGSTMYGNKVHSSKNLKSFSSVGAGSYGAHHLITAPGGQSVFYSSSKVYSAAAKYTAPTGLLPYGITGDISLTASIGYNSKLTLEYGGPNQIHNKKVYDYNSGGSDWYVSQNQ